MNNFARAHNSYLEPPDDDPVCEDGCGETLVKEWTGNTLHPHYQEWICVNKFCPLKFQGVEQEMAQALVDAKDDLSTWKYKYEKLKREFEQYKENLR